MIKTALGEPGVVSLDALPGGGVDNPIIAQADGNRIDVTDSYFGPHNTDGPGTLIGEGMHMKQFGTADGTIGDAAFARALKIPFTDPGLNAPIELQDLAASAHFHQYIEAACPAKW